MCGIAGIVSLKSEVLISKLEKMTKSLYSRGPDFGANWIYKNKKVGLGHRRLSIIDLSEKGNQPMIVDNRYSIVFNGEIYNYRSLRNELIKTGHNYWADFIIMQLTLSAFNINIILLNKPKDVPKDKVNVTNSRLNLVTPKKIKT